MEADDGRNRRRTAQRRTTKAVAVRPFCRCRPRDIFFFFFFSPVSIIAVVVARRKRRRITTADGDNSERLSTTSNRVGGSPVVSHVAGARTVYNARRRRHLRENMLTVAYTPAPSRDQLLPRSNPQYQPCHSAARQTQPPNSTLYYKSSRPRTARTPRMINCRFFDIRFDIAVFRLNFLRLQIHPDNPVLHINPRAQ